MAYPAVKGVYWLCDSDFPVYKIESNLFTHIFWGFANLDPKTYNSVLEPQTLTTYKVYVDEIDNFSIFTTTVLQKNPGVKTLISIGGPKADVSAFVSMASNGDARKIFIDSSIKLARDYRFDGLDLDWEYPASDIEMANFGLLLQEWRVAVAVDAGNPTQDCALLLTATVSSRPIIKNVKEDQSHSYPFKIIEDNLDWIHVKEYDFYSSKQEGDKTHAPAALYDPVTNTNVSGSHGIIQWILCGVKPQKMVLGISFYGYGWKLKDPNNNGILAPADGPAPWTGLNGSLEYYFIKAFIGKNSATTFYDPTYVTDYCYQGKTWFAYDGVPSVKSKVSYLKDLDLRGYFAWHVGADDLNGELSSAASQALDGP
ncbi:class V chitinase-like [Impatiens glandulifera]|uniref:class V chitinase-like n=1 Tax=Impatiens glandulifera TaxID=253017 RepID=UPI001FB05A45|nr:class V chitinase-like [Impatiens glandulifera]